jgi:hypothetical protein
MLELSDVFNRYGGEYLKERKLPWEIIKAINAIRNCRTEALGGRIYSCEECGTEVELYNSCRNRHCPKCQGNSREKWLKKRMKELLPIGYFHVVLTVPHELNELFQRNKKEMYNILFKSSSETLLKLSKDPKYLGAEIGFMSVLHTWGQTLVDHYHIHSIVPGGGLSKNEKRWISLKNEKYLFPKDVMSELFKKIFLSNLEKRKEKMSFGENLRDDIEFKNLKNKLYMKKWITYCKEPFGSAEEVIEYLGRYTHRVAITNNRIKDIESGEIKFKYKDYSDNNKMKTMKLDAKEFIRRFLLHILPTGFVKIRYFGIISNKNKKEKLKKSLELIRRKEKKNERRLRRKKKVDLLQELIKSYKECPKCDNGEMIFINTLYPKLIRAP